VIQRHTFVKSWCVAEFVIHARGFVAVASLLPPYSSIYRYVFVWVAVVIATFEAPRRDESRRVARGGTWIGDNKVQAKQGAYRQEENVACDQERLTNVIVKNYEVMLQVIIGSYATAYSTWRESNKSRRIPRSCTSIGDYQNPSRHTYRAKWLSNLPAFEASALVKTGGAVVTATLAIIIGI